MNSSIAIKEWIRWAEKPDERAKKLSELGKRRLSCASVNSVQFSNLFFGLVQPTLPFNRFAHWLRFYQTLQHTRRLNFFWIAQKWRIFWAATPRQNHKTEAKTNIFYVRRKKYWSLPLSVSIVFILKIMQDFEGIW